LNTQKVGVSYKDVLKAADKIKSHIIETPCAPSTTLSNLTGAEVFLKFENFQFTGSFKERGVLAKLLSLPAEARKKGVLTMSAGNHGQALAYHAKRLEIPAVVVMPSFTPNVKVEQTVSFGAEVLLEGEGVDEAGALARQTAEERKMILVHPYDDEEVLAGQGTVALEMLKACPQLEALIVPIGGGGLISGVALAAKHLNPAIEIYGVQSARFPAMVQALQAEGIECRPPTIAEGLAVKTPGNLALPIVRELVKEIFLVEENELEKALLLYLEIEKTVVEGAGAAGLAALIQQNRRFKRRKVGLILTGGNIDLMVLSSIIQRGLVRSGRLARLLIEIRDIPGALAELTRLLGEWRANIIEVHHQRAFTSLPVQSVEVEIILQARGLAHLREIISRLYQGGYKVRLPEKDLEKSLLHQKVQPFSGKGFPSSIGH
jgi:threonine dehydratase